MKLKALIAVALIACFIPLQAISLTLTKRQLCDLELILEGGFSPLKGFLDRKNYETVVSKMCLADGTLWPIPITLDVDREAACRIKPGDKVQLQNEQGVPLAIIHVSDMWTPDKSKEALHVYGTTDHAHPGVSYLLEKTHDTYIGGEVSALNPMIYYEFADLRKTPSELKAYFREKGIKKVVAFQTRNPLHRAHVALTKIATAMTGAHLLIHPVVGETKEGDIDPYTRVRCYRKILKYFPENQTTLALLPLAMRMAGPREALWHAIIRKNYGCTHFIIGRDHAGPGVGSNGKPFYDPYEAQNLVKLHAKEIGIEVVSLPEVVFVKEQNDYLPVTEVQPGMTELKISGTELRRCLQSNLEIPEWFSYPEVISELQKINPSRSEQGFTLFFTGLSGSGKSTLINALNERLREVQYRPVTLLDGDIIRRNLSSELGFSAKDRSTNVRRVGFVASEITKHKGIALCALIAPYEQDRLANRHSIETVGGYIEIYLSTPLETCEKRDIKGLYSKARDGIIKNFTGINDPYQPPIHPELEIDTTHLSVKEAVDQIIDFLTKEKYIEPV
ncbi:MAG: bifunctional sulfate adenylyltransferase/adenylylsulfate kinase [Chlamydiales bacterium]